MPTESKSETPWSLTTADMINKLTPDIKGKAFSPDWFLLRQRLEEYDAIEKELNEAKRKEYKRFPIDGLSPQHESEIQRLQQERNTLAKENEQLRLECKQNNQAACLFDRDAAIADKDKYTEENKLLREALESYDKIQISLSIPEWLDIRYKALNKCNTNLNTSM